MKDIKGVEVFPGDKCLMSTNHGFTLVTYLKDTTKSFVFNDSIKLPRAIKNNYMGWEWMHPDGSKWDFSKHGHIDYALSTVHYLGDNNTAYKLTDISGDNQKKILKVDDNFSL